MDFKKLIKRAEEDLIKRNYEQKKKRLLEKIGEYFYRLYLTGEMEDIPEDIRELMEKIRHIDKRIVKLEHDED